MVKKHINKKILSETSLYFGDVKMPKGWEIEKDILVKDATLSSYYEDVKYPYTRTSDRLRTYINDFLHLEHSLHLEYFTDWGNYYERNQISKPMIHIDFASLKDSPDFVLLYGIEIDNKSCQINISYDDHKRKNISWTIDLKTNKFIMFPSSLNYFISNEGNSFLNYIQTYLFKEIKYS